MQRFPRDYLEQLCNEAEFDREHEEVKEIEERIISLVDEVSKYIGRKDPLFKNFVIPSGSYFEDLKVEGPDEFDFMLCLERLSKPGVCVVKDIPLRPVPDPGYVDVQVASDSVRRAYREQRYISNRGNLKSELLLKRFQDLIKKALARRKRRPREKIAEDVQVELRKIPVTFRVRWKGRKYPNYEVAVDLTLCIKLSGEWPAASDIRRRLYRGHPGYDFFQEAVRKGYHLVASTIGESGKHRPCWRLSFSVAEGIVLKSIFNNPRLVHKVTLKVLKVLRKKHEEDLCLYEAASTSFNVTWAFHSYVLKTMFLHEWCEFPGDSYWTNDKLEERVIGILERIQNSVKERDIRSFWVPAYKLFNFRARNTTQTKECENNLSRLIKNFQNLHI